MYQLVSIAGNWKGLSRDYDKLIGQKWQENILFHYRITKTNRLVVAYHVLWKNEFTRDQTNSLCTCKGGVSQYRSMRVPTFLDNNFMLIVEIAQQLRPMRFQCGSFLLICDWFVKAYPRHTLSHTHTCTQLHTLYTPFFWSFSWKRGRRAPSTQDVQFIHIWIRSMSLCTRKP